MSDHFSTQFKSAAERVSRENPILWDGIRVVLQYLVRYRHGAVAPDVRWGIASSRFGSNCGEIRWPDPDVQGDHPNDAWRGLFVAHPLDTWYVFTILGNKARTGNRWYEKAVAESDALVVQAIKQLDLESFPGK